MTARAQTHTPAAPGRLSIRSLRTPVPVLKTTATTGTGVPELMKTLREIGAKGGDAMTRRRRRARYLIARAAADIVARMVKEGAGSELEGLADEVLKGRATPDAAARTLLKF